MSGHEIATRTFSGRVVSASACDFDSLVRRDECLSVTERNRAGKFHRRDDRKAFVARRVFLRELLGVELDLPPEEVTLAITSRGKPQLGLATRSLSFSQSATHGRTVVALSRAGEVGVDIEWLERPIDHNGLARRWFPPRETSWVEKCTSAEDASVEFMRIWTAREAAAKLTGQGMAFCLGHHEVCTDPWRVISLDGAPPISIETRLEPRYLLSVAWSCDSHKMVKYGAGTTRKS